MILMCVCIHDTQDRIHGRGKRVHNVTKAGTARCTVCKIEKGLSQSQIKDAKKK